MQREASGRLLRETGNLFSADGAVFHVSICDPGQQITEWLSSSDLGREWLFVGVNGWRRLRRKEIKGLEPITLGTTA